MPAYTTTEPAFVNNRMVQPGERFEYDGPPGAHMEPWKDERGREDRDARKAKDAAGEIVGPGHPDYLGKLIGHNVDGGETNAKVGGASTYGVATDASGEVRGVTVQQEADEQHSGTE